MDTKRLCDPPTTSEQSIGTPHDSLVDEPQPSYHGSVWTTYIIIPPTSPLHYLGNNLGEHISILGN
jgi:hypothetical protein